MNRMGFWFRYPWSVVELLGNNKDDARDRSAALLRNHLLSIFVFENTRLTLVLKNSRPTSGKPTRLGSSRTSRDWGVTPLR